MTGQVARLVGDRLRTSLRACAHPNGPRACRLIDEMPQPAWAAVLEAATAGLVVEPADEPRVWLSVDEASEEARVGRRTIFNWMRRGWVVVRRLPNGRRQVLRQSLEAPP